MSDQHNHYNGQPRSGGSGAIFFIVGGLVVAVAVIGWILTGGDFMVADNGPSDVNVSVESSSGASATDENAELSETEPAAPADTDTADASAGATATTGNN